MKEEYFDKAFEFNNLYKALKESCKNVRWKDSVVGYENNGIVNTMKLRKPVLNNTYHISPYQIFTIHEPKERQIAATRIKDRQMQKALCNAGLYKDITEHFVYDNVACQLNKGTDFALNRMTRHLRKYYLKYGTDGWVLKCDIEKFFPSTLHKVAKDAIKKRVSDIKARDAVFNVIDSFEGDKGIGLGSQISQLIELAVLDDLDHLIKEKLRIKYYIRYMDDFVLIHQDKKYLQYCKNRIINYLNSIGLKLNKKTSLYPLKQGVKFIQWHFYLTDSGKIIKKMNSKKFSNEKRKLKKLLKKEKIGQIKQGSSEISMTSWIANAQRGNSYRKIQEMKNFYKTQKITYV